jgi:hypothetical protein
METASLPGGHGRLGLPGRRGTLDLPLGRIHWTNLRDRTLYTFQVHRKQTLTLPGRKGTLTLPGRKGTLTLPWGKETLDSAHIREEGDTYPMVGAGKLTSWSQGASGVPSGGSPGVMSGRSPE